MTEKLLLGGSFVQNVDLLNKIVDFLNKTVDLLFEKGGSPAHTEPPGYRPDICEWNYQRTNGKITGNGTFTALIKINTIVTFGKDTKYH